MGRGCVRWKIGARGSGEGVQRLRILAARHVQCNGVSAREQVRCIHWRSAPQEIHHCRGCYPPHHKRLAITSTSGTSSRMNDAAPTTRWPSFLDELRDFFASKGEELKVGAKRATTLVEYPGWDGYLPASSFLGYGGWAEEPSGLRRVRVGRCLFSTSRRLTWRSCGVWLRA